jgi:hypothetical protein
MRDAWLPATEGRTDLIGFFCCALSDNPRGTGSRPIFIDFGYNPRVRVLTNEAAALLALGEGPVSGVGLMSRLRSGVSGDRVLRPGTLYPLLRRLESRGLVRSWVERERPSVGRPRRFVELTAGGLA